MTEARVQLQCPACEETWEANPADLPAPGRAFVCRHCGDERPTPEFMRTGRSLETLESFHAA
jgi:hypothetical protein